MKLLFVVGLTGAVNTLAMPIEQVWQATELIDMASTHKDKPVPSFASPHHYGVSMVGATAVTSRLLTPALDDAGTGEITSLREMPMYVKALFISQPLHFGDYGGLPLKILWAILDLLTIMGVVNGLYLWLLRRKSKVNVAQQALLDENNNEDLD